MIIHARRERLLSVTRVVISHDIRVCIQHRRPNRRDSRRAHRRGGNTAEVAGPKGLLPGIFSRTGFLEGLGRSALCVLWTSAARRNRGRPGVGPRRRRPLHAGRQPVQGPTALHWSTRFFDDAHGARGPIPRQVAGFHRTGGHRVELDQQRSKAKVGLRIRKRSSYHRDGGETITKRRESILGDFLLDVTTGSSGSRLLGDGGRDPIVIASPRGTTSSRR